MVIIDPAIVDKIPRAPSALAPKTSGQRVSHRVLASECAAIKATAMAMLPATISAGKSQKLVRSLSQSRLSEFTSEASAATLHFE
jgi:hypothetical protein